jgi:hypothetical protein
MTLLFEIGLRAIFFFNTMARKTVPEERAAVELKIKHFDFLACQELVFAVTAIFEGTFWVLYISHARVCFVLPVAENLLHELQPLFSQLPCMT